MVYNFDKQYQQTRELSKQLWKFCVRQSFYIPLQIKAVWIGINIHVTRIDAALSTSILDRKSFDIIKTDH